jgi:hypothetical protein
MADPVADLLRALADLAERDADAARALAPLALLAGSLVAPAQARTEAGIVRRAITRKRTGRPSNPAVKARNRKIADAYATARDMRDEGELTPEQARTVARWVAEASPRLGIVAEATVRNLAAGPRAQVPPKRATLLRRLVRAILRGHHKKSGDLP